METRSRSGRQLPLPLGESRGEGGRALRAFLLPVLCAACLASLASAQRPQMPLISAADAPPGVTYEVSAASQRLEMIVNTSRILKMSAKVPKIQVQNPEVVRLTPLSPNEIQIAALKPGVTSVVLWDEYEKVHTVDIIVMPDARELQLLLETEFPNSSIRVRPLASRVVLTGYVDRPDVVARIIRIAEDYYPEVINNISVGGVQTVVLEVKIMEVSRTKLRQLGFDWANVNGDDFVISSVSGLIDAAATAAGTAAGLGGDTVRFGVVNGANQFFGFIQALRQYNLIKVLAEPTLTTISGRPASFNVGGEFPILIPGGLGTTTVEFKEFGTRVDFVPIVLGNGKLRLEVRPSVSEIDPARSVTIDDITVPGLRTRWVDTAVEMESGQTLALAGLIQERTEAENVGLPWIADVPWAGAAFRRVKEVRNEIELLVIVTPRLVHPLEPGQVPQCGPGTRTTSPCDTELYWKGYLEVPKCCPQGGHPTAGPWVNDPSLPAGAMVVPGAAPNAYGGFPAGPEMIPPGAEPGPPQLPSRSVAPPPVTPPPASAARWKSKETSLAQPRSTPRPAQPKGGHGLIGPVGFDDLRY